MYCIVSSVDDDNKTVWSELITYKKLQSDGMPTTIIVGMGGLKSGKLHSNEWWILYVNMYVCIRMHSLQKGGESPSFHQELVATMHTRPGIVAR